MSRSYGKWPNVAAGSCAWLLAAGLVQACGGSEDAPKDAATVADAGPTKSDAAAVVDAGRDAGTLPVDAGHDATVDAGRDSDAAADAGPGDPPVPGNDPPKLTKVGFFNDELGARIVLQGSDPNGDVAHYTIKFFKGTTAVLLDADGNGDTPDTGSFTNALTPTAGQKDFFARFDPSLDLLDKVDNVKISVDDAMSNVSSELMAVLGPAPVASGTCSSLGFDRCANNSVCAPGAGASYHCSSLASARASACAAPLVLSPPGVTSVRGTVAPPSLWDAPAGCATNDPVRQPDTMVKLTLATAASTVVLSTDNANTPFDTMLYRVAMCTASPSPCVDASCACAQDISPTNPRSQLTLHNLAAGDYWIVVDSFPSTDAKGDAFELTVSLP
ncbi:MAG: hypothetical protein JWN48_651 [Myxococcaceae bacterium]|nr:hypothetical protein [Myxococcaceae bacterium]